MNKNLQRVLAGLISLSVFAAPFVTRAALANICGTEVGSYWRVTKFPTFKDGPNEATDFAIDASSPNRIMVTNGTSVYRTTDSACSWKLVYTLGAPSTPALPGLPAATSNIVSIDISEARRDLVLLMVEETNAATTTPHVIRSDDMGESWTAGDVGLPPQGKPEALVLARSEPNLAYLSIDEGGGTVDVMFASTDGGATWTPRSGPGALSSQMSITGFTVDPIESSSLWAWGAGVYHSTDGGQSFTVVPDFIGSTVSTVDVFHSGSDPARIAGFKPLESTVLVSTNGGNTWLSRDTPAGVDSSAHGDGTEKVYITAAGTAFGFFAPGAWINLASPRPGVVDANTDRAGVVYMRAGNELLSWEGPDKFSPDQVPDDIFNAGAIDPPLEYQPRDPALTPGRKKVVLDPGESRTIKYDLALSKTPLPVNVFFLLDTSDSMGATIEDLSRSVVDITNLLNKENFALKIGVGAFRAFPDHLPPRPRCGSDEDTGVQTCETNYVFRNYYDIAPASPTVEEVLENLESDAGGFYKSHLQALYTLATGDRVDLFPPGSDSGDVPEGEGATFDDEAYRVVIHATDEAFWKGEARDGGNTDFGNPSPPETPLFDEVKAALNAKQIYQVGLSIGPAPRNDLQRVATDTNALAPAGGVDCGKGHILQPGDPLVCPVSRNNLTQSHNLVPAIVNLIENLPTRVAVDYEVEGNPRVVRDVTPEQTDDVVLQVANDLGFEVTYRCPLDLAGKSFDIDLSATNTEKAELLDDAATTVVCRETPKHPLIPPIVAVSLVALAIPPPPPPPPAQLTSASQAQSQAQAQTGAVFEEEKQPQLAIAAAYREAAQMENDYEYEMVAYEGRKQPVSPYLTLGAGAVMTSMAYAGMMIQRTRQNRRLALQHNRRRR